MFSHTVLLVFFIHFSNNFSFTLSIIKAAFLNPFLFDFNFHFPSFYVFFFFFFLLANNLFLVLVVGYLLYLFHRVSLEDSIFATRYLLCSALIIFQTQFLEITFTNNRKQGKTKKKNFKNSKILKKNFKTHKIFKNK